MEERERIALLMRAAEEVETADLRHQLLQWAEELVRNLTVPVAQRRNNRAPTPDFAPTWPLPMTIRSNHLDKTVSGLLHRDGTMEVEGERYGTPSSNRFCDKYLSHRTNTWRMWKFEAGEDSYLIDVLRVQGAVGTGHRENSRQFRVLSKQSD